MEASSTYGTVPLSPKHKNTPTDRTTVGQHCNLDACVMQETPDSGQPQEKLPWRRRW